MRAVNKIRNILRGLKQGWGTPGMKRALWNREFSSGRWNFIENTSGDVVYQYIEKYCKNGSILDLGCGSGNTGCELDPSKYQDYTGVDISDFAIQMAARRSKEKQRDDKNRYFQADIATYTPTVDHNVILFRESIYYIPRPKIRRVLDKYCRYLAENGVFIVRGHAKEEGESILRVLGSGYTVVEQCAAVAPGPFVVAFRKTSDGRVQGRLTVVF
jgi:SAM-dependent methyltransferase